RFQVAVRADLWILDAAIHHGDAFGGADECDRWVLAQRLQGPCPVAGLERRVDLGIAVTERVESRIRRPDERRRARWPDERPKQQQVKVLALQHPKRILRRDEPDISAVASQRSCD